MMLDCTMEISFLGILVEWWLALMVGSGFVGFIFRGMRICFSQDHICRGVEEFQKMQHLQCQRRIAELSYYHEVV